MEIQGSAVRFRASVIRRFPNAGIDARISRCVFPATSKQTIHTRRVAPASPRRAAVNLAVIRTLIDSLTRADSTYPDVANVQLPSNRASPPTTSLSRTSPATRERRRIKNIYIESHAICELSGFFVFPDGNTPGRAGGRQRRQRAPRTRARARRRGGERRSSLP